MTADSSAQPLIGRAESCLVPGALTHGGTVLLDVFDLMNTCNAHAPSLHVSVSCRTTMAFAEMLSDENIKAAVQACHGESNHICTYSTDC